VLGKEDMKDERSKGKTSSSQNVAILFYIISRALTRDLARFASSLLLSPPSKEWERLTFFEDDIAFSFNSFHFLQVNNCFNHVNLYVCTLQYFYTFISIHKAVYILAVRLQWQGFTLILGFKLFLIGQLIGLHFAFFTEESGS
jgi:hypothetical protein